MASEQGTATGGETMSLPDFLELTIVEMVNGAAQARGDVELTTEAIVEAFGRVEAGIVECARYPSGAPTLTGLYEIAAEIQGEA
jgi:hypothetical protein